MSLDVYNRSGEVVRQQDIPAAFNNTEMCTSHFSSTPPLSIENFGKNFEVK